MKSSTITLTAFASFATAEFWVARAIITQGDVVCPTPITCTNPTTREDTFILRGDEKEDCDVISGFSVENGQFTDPLCPGDEDPNQPFDLKNSRVVCDQDEDTTFYFRVSTTDDEKLDVSLDEDFGDIIATCYRDADCEDEEMKVCDETDVLYHYRCDAANGSSC